MKKIIALIIALAVMVSLCACASKSSTESNDKAGGKTTTEQKTVDESAEKEPSGGNDSKIVIGISMPSLQSTFFEGEKSMAEQTAKNAGVEYISVVADGDATKQKSQIEDLISKNVDAIICVPQDTQAIVSSIADCKKAGIPFIAMGRMPADMTDVALAITCDNYICAEVCANAIAEAAGKLGYEKIKAIELVGDLKDQNAVERDEGFKKYAAEKNIEIVAEVATEWDADKCFARLTDTLQSVDDFNAIYVPSDFLLPTIMSVLKTNNRWVPMGEEGHVIIASIDGDPSAMEFITSGYVYATANTDAFDFGRLAMEGAIEIAKGNMPDEVSQPVPVKGLTKEVIEAAGDTIWGNVYKN